MMGEQPKAEHSPNLPTWQEMAGKLAALLRVESSDENLDVTEGPLAWQIHDNEVESTLAEYGLMLAKAEHKDTPR